MRIGWRNTAGRWSGSPHKPARQGWRSAVSSSVSTPGECHTIGVVRTTLKAVNDELGRRGYTARLAKSAGYFYFHFGEAAEWLDRTVPGERVSDRSVEQWLSEFERLRDLNKRLMPSEERTGRTPRKKK